MNAYDRFQQITSTRENPQDALEYLDAAAGVMDAALRERVAAMFDGTPGIDGGDFLKIYCRLHAEKFETQFLV